MMLLRLVEQVKYCLSKQRGKICTCNCTRIYIYIYIYTCKRTGACNFKSNEITICVIMRFQAEQWHFMWSVTSCTVTYCNVKWCNVMCLKYVCMDGWVDARTWWTNVWMDGWIDEGISVSARVHVSLRACACVCVCVCVCACVVCVRGACVCWCCVSHMFWDRLTRRRHLTSPFNRADKYQHQHTWTPLQIASRTRCVALPAAQRDRKFEGLLCLSWRLLLQSEVPETFMEGPQGCLQKSPGCVGFPWPRGCRSR